MRKIGKYIFRIGLLVIAAGFIYDTMFAGIPPQDPPPDLQIKFDRDSKIASEIMISGVIVTLTGGLMWLVDSVRKRLIKKN